MSAREPEDDRLPDPAGDRSEPAVVGDRSEPAVVGDTGDYEDVRAESFEEIVAGWQREGRVPEWPGERSDLAGGPIAARPAAQPGPTTPAGHDEHFVPPEPPPLPRIGPPAVVGLALLAFGLILLIAPSVLGVTSDLGLPLGLLGLASGLGWLVLRLWPSPPPAGDGDGEDDGAVL